MPRSVKGFVVEKLYGLLYGDYRRDRNFLSRWRHRNDPHTVHLSPDLFERLMVEKQSPAGSDSVKLDEVIEGEVIVRDRRYSNERYPNLARFDIVIDVHGHYPVGYSPEFYGVR